MTFERLGRILLKTETESRRAAVYARISTDRQSADSPADQISRCRDFAISHKQLRFEAPLNHDLQLTGAYVAQLVIAHVGSGEAYPEVEDVDERAVWFKSARRVRVVTLRARSSQVTFPAYLMSACRLRTSVRPPRRSAKKRKPRNLHESEGFAR